MLRTLAVVFAMIISVALSGQELRDLTVEGRSDAMFIETDKPHFSWRIEGKKNVVQTTYRITVSSSADSLKSGVADVWDSGFVLADSTCVVYGATTDTSGVCKTLQQGRKYYWQVEVKTNKRKKLLTSTGAFSTSMLGKPITVSAMIAYNGLIPDGEVEERLGKHIKLIGRYLRKTFSTDKFISRATAYVAGPGGYILYINGHQVSEPLAGLLKGEDGVITYDVHDIADYVTADNVFAAVLGTGNHYANDTAFVYAHEHAYSFPQFFANIVIEYTDGTKDVIATNNSWKLNTSGPICYSAGLDGECYDARKEFGAWTTTEYNDSAWTNAELLLWPKTKMKVNEGPNLHVNAVEKPLTLTQTGNKYIADFGTEVTGRVRVKANVSKGDTITIRHAKSVNDDGTQLDTSSLNGYDATVYYVSNGELVSYAPDFTLLNFRYVELSLPEGIRDFEIERDVITSKEVH